MANSPKPHGEKPMYADAALDVLTDRTLVGRFEHYFKHPDADHELLGPGDRAVACKNAKKALNSLQYRAGNGDEYNEALVNAVKKFQADQGHINGDGVIGPGTRARLVTALLRKFGAAKFSELDASQGIYVPTVFLSYAWADSQRVDKLDQWLRDHSIRVIRDTDSFEAGIQVRDAIWRSVLSADRVIAVYSKQSRTRDWPSLERDIAGMVETQIKAPLLIYLCLDNTPLKKYDQHRIAIKASGKPLKRVGSEIQKSLGIALEHIRIEYDENRPL